MVGVSVKEVLVGVGEHVSETSMRIGLVEQASETSLRMGLGLVEHASETSLRMGLGLVEYTSETSLRMGLGLVEHASETGMVKRSVMMCLMVVKIDLVEIFEVLVASSHITSLAETDVLEDMIAEVGAVVNRFHQTENY